MTLVRALKAVLTCLLAVSLFGADPADNWPHWRGPHLDGRSTTAKNLPVSWSETENVVWRTRLPSWAAATPVVWEDTVFVTSAQEGFTPNKGAGMVGGALERLKSAFHTSDQLLLLALHRKDGSIRWQKVIGEGNTFLNKQNMASPTPVTDGRHVWVITGLGDLSCLDFEGNLGLGTQHLERLLGVRAGVRVRFVSGASRRKALHSGLAWHEDGRTVVSRRGRRREREDRLESGASDGCGLRIAGFLLDADARRSCRQDTARCRRRRLPDRTRSRYRTRDMAGGRTQPPEGPQLSHDCFSARCPGYCFCAEPREALHRFPCRRQRGCFGVAPALVNAAWAGRAYSGERRRTTVHRQRQGITLCLRVADGSEVWGRSRMEPGTYSASPVLADGKIYATNEEGTTTVIEAGDEFKILGKNKLNDYTLASPAVSGGQIFIRTSNYLYCLAD